MLVSYIASMLLPQASLCIILRLFRVARRALELYRAEDQKLCARTGRICALVAAHKTHEGVFGCFEGSPLIVIKPL